MFLSHYEHILGFYFYANLYIAQSSFVFFKISNNSITRSHLLLYLINTRRTFTKAINYTCINAISFSQFLLLFSFDKLCISEVWSLNFFDEYQDNISLIRAYIYLGNSGVSIYIHFGV